MTYPSDPYQSGPQQGGQPYGGQPQYPAQPEQGPTPPPYGQPPNPAQPQYGQPQYPPQPAYGGQSGSPAQYPTSGGPQYPTSGGPQNPTSGGPQYPTSGGPQYSGADYATQQFPTMPAPYPAVNPYGAPPPSGKTNALAITSLITSFFAPFFAFIFGLVALRQIKRSGDKGRGLAVAGVAVSSVLMLALCAVGVVAAIAANDPNKGEAGNRKTTVDVLDDGVSLKIGDCFNVDQAGSDETLVNSQMKVVPCTTKHTEELFAQTKAAGSTFPGRDAMLEESRTYCSGQLDTYVLDTWTLPEKVTISYFMPTAETWGTGDRQILCALEEDNGLTVSLKMDESKFNDNQVRYLKIINPVDDQFSEMTNDNGDPPPVAEMQAKASAMSGLLKTEVAALRDAEWPSSARTRISRLATAHSNWQKLWAKVAQADSDSGIQEAYTKALDFDDFDEYIAVRDVLGLPTEQGGKVTT